MPPATTLPPLLRASPIAALALAVFVAGGCGRKPARVEVDLPELLLDKDAHPIAARVFDKAGQPLDVKMSRALHPDWVGALEGDALRCKQTGEGTVTVTAGAVAGKRAFRCRVMAGWKVDTRILVAPDAPTSRPPAQVHNEYGRTFPDVLPAFEVVDAGVARIVEGGGIQPLRPGRTELRATLAGETRTRPLIVARRRTTDRLTIAPGQRVAVPLPEAAEFIAEIAQQTVLAPRGVRASWSEPSCAPLAEARLHDAACLVTAPGVLTLENPDAATPTPIEVTITLWQLP